MPKKHNHVSTAKAVELYLHNNRDIPQTAKQLKTTYSVVYNRLQKAGLKKSYKHKLPDKKIKIKSDGYTLTDINKLLPPEGEKIATPKGIGILVKVYPYTVAVKGKDGRIEFFTKGDFLTCYLKAAKGEKYIEETEE